jgi:hypothetical protein
MDPDTARLVLQLDHAITASRAGQGTGVHAFDAARRFMIGSMPEVLPGTALYRVLPARADRVELAILTALAQRYGAALLTDSTLGSALRLIARDGGVALVQRVLWSESAADADLCATLAAVQAALSEISLAFPDAFFAEANALIAACCPFTPRPPGLPSSKKGGDRA